MVNYANRGMKLEKLIDQTNDIYREMDIADIRKIPTPVKILGASKGMIRGHVMPSTWVDYSGIYDFKCIIFDAKETKGKSWSLKNITDKQYSLLESFDKKGAIAFLIIHFSDEGKYYYLPFQSLEWAFKRQSEGGRKSISLSDCEEIAKEIFVSSEFGLNYLGAIE